VVVVTLATLVQFAMPASYLPISAFWRLMLDSSVGVSGNIRSLSAAIGQGIVTMIANITIGIGRLQDSEIWARVMLTARS
jgi:formiminotetrahydrofolate cyclodeaminase